MTEEIVEEIMTETADEIMIEGKMSTEEILIAIEGETSTGIQIEGETWTEGGIWTEDEMKKTMKIPKFMGQSLIDKKKKKGRTSKDKEIKYMKMQRLN
jgi:hypothetical protein